MENQKKIRKGLLKTQSFFFVFTLIVMIDMHKLYKKLMLICTCREFYFDGVWIRSVYWFICRNNGYYKHIKSRPENMHKHLIIC